ncbi:MAG: 7-carboxy-7-deazaguanine synthase [Gammaproteobacteria bacterium]|jgi:7-carboxy-7-deazaguanine synthase|nr:7-carboxy-7-deazaguanine synthase [Gammaproteobacteria bacterium]
MELRITEIFLSLQGETRTVGLPTVFVRLTGCPLRCGYCDTAYAFKGGKKMQLEQIVSELKKYQVRHVTITGGEPLAQKNCLPLMSRLCDEGYEVSIETSGALDVSEIDSRVTKVVDLKTPGSKECAKNLYENIQHLNKKDQVKFVICHREDYDWSVAMMKQYDLANKCEVLFSPSYQELSGTTLADWIVHDQLPVRFQIQLHKILWQDQPGK